jgi:hypothetical protein
VSTLAGDEADSWTETQVEGHVAREGRELQRKLIQAHLDVRFERERTAVARTKAARRLQRRRAKWPIVEVRARRRQLETQFGRVAVSRHSQKVRGRRARFAMDRRLNLPKDMYSLPLRRWIVEQVCDVSWDGALKRMASQTAAHVPKRQAEQLVQRSAKDLEAFYESRFTPLDPSKGRVLVLSSDAKGVRVLHRALRDQTREAAEAEAQSAVRGDPMAPKKLRRHDRRMAAVTAVWEQDLYWRTPEEIIAQLRAPRGESSEREKRRQLPRPLNKRLRATLLKGQREAIREMFDEADRRDPQRQCTTIVLVDGLESQLTAVLDEARAHNRTVIVVADLIHVIHYLWQLGEILCDKDDVATDAWVLDRLALLLRRPNVQATLGRIRREGEQASLGRGKQKAFDKALGYLDKIAEYIRYQEFIGRGFPIATGVIEGACRHLIQDRLGITGARWDLPSAEAVLKLRAVRSSGDFEDYWTFHEQQEALRNYADAA